MQKFINKQLIINVSDNKENYSQRNNKYIHFNKSGLKDIYSGSVCNTTSICQALDYNGWKFPDLGKWNQPEDALSEFIATSEDVDLRYKTKMPALYKEYKEEKMTNGKVDYYTPNEIHDLLAFGTNKWLGVTNAVTFKESSDIWDIIKELINGRACVISGKFVGLNHIVTLVGCAWNFKEIPKISLNKLISTIIKERRMPSQFIIDDPYGDFHKNYKAGFSGNDIRLTIDEFYSMIKPLGNTQIKMCHFIQNGAAIV